MAGLLLKMHYETEFVQLAQISNTADRVVQVGATITTPKFSEVYPVVVESANYWKKVASEYYPPEEREADRAKGNLPEKPLAVEFILDALREDGYFQ